ncbi:MAG: hypothetical protein V9G21_03555 [Methylotenera sp.]
MKKHHERPHLYFKKITIQPNWIAGNSPPNLLANLTIAEIKNIPLSSQKNAPKVADFFEVTGDDVQTIHFNNSHCTARLSSATT